MHDSLQVLKIKGLTVLGMYTFLLNLFWVLRVWLYLKVYILLINNFILKEKEISKSNSKFCKNKSENWLSKILVCPQYALDGNYIG